MKSWKIGMFVLIFLALAIPMVNAQWWNTGYSNKYNVSCINMTDRLPMIVNGSGGFMVNGEIQYIHTYCSGNGTAVYFNDNTDVVVANHSEQLPSCSENSSSKGNNCPLVFGTDAAQTEIAAFGMTNFSDMRNKHDLLNDSTLPNKTGKIAGSQLFNESDRQNLSASLNSMSYTNQQFTIMAWVSADHTGYSAIINKPSVCANCNQRWRLGTDAASSVDFFIDGSGAGGDQCEATGTTNIADGTFHFISGVLRADDSIDVYVDGNQEGTDTACPDVNDGDTQPVYIGIEMVEGGTFAYPFNGTVDNLWIINRSYTDLEINQTYNNQQNLTTFGTLEAEEIIYSISINSPTDNSIHNTSIMNVNYTITTGGRTIDKCYYTLNNTVVNLTDCENITLTGLVSSGHNLSVYSNASDKSVVNDTVFFKIQQVEVYVFDNLTLTNLTSFTSTWEKGGGRSTTSSVIFHNLTNVNGSSYFILSGTNMTSRTITLNVNESYNQTYIMNRAGLNVFVFDEYDSSNITNFNISVNNDLNNYAFEGSSISSMFISISNITAGAYAVRVSSAGYDAREYNVIVTGAAYNEVLAYLPESDRTKEVLFLTRNIQGDYISGTNILIERSIGGVWTNIHSETTDASGGLTVDLIEEFTYRLTVSKSGYDTLIASIKPTSSQYELVLNSTVDISIDDIWDGLFLRINPVAAILNNQTVNFTVEIIDTNELLVSYSFRLTNNSGSGAELVFVSGNSAGGGLLNHTVMRDTLILYNNMSLYLNVTINKTGFGGLSRMKVYKVSVTKSGGFSLLDVFVAIKDETHGVSTIDGMFIGVVMLMLLMMGAATFGTYGAGIAGAIGSSILMMVGLMPWMFTVLIWIIVVAVISVKEIR